ncbi:hypothetical protein ON010_g763 [Phytophthora cinnamomi]|nr:hypothetical protein ON010_g763 [Phytophthora cinnamomi]
MHQALLLQTARFWRGFNGDQKSLENNQQEDARHSTLPYEVRVVNLEDLTTERGELLPLDSSALLQHFSTRSVLALDWVDNQDYFSFELRAPEDIPDEVVEAAKTDQDLRADLDAAASLEQKANGPEENAPAMDDDDSPPMYAVPLTKCMDALMREEAISLEDHWVCERCGVPREGSRFSAIWRLPDLVMVQLKRFQYLENQHKQKVRALVDFPLKGLDFSKWMGHQDAAGSSVYDLYAVANHVGGLTRGHYTAYCRYDSDFPESSSLFKANEENGDVQCPELWFRFDDEKVSEIAPGDVVTDAAYVLFYKRRTLSPHNHSDELAGVPSQAELSSVAIGATLCAASPAPAPDAEWSRRAMKIEGQNANGTARGCRPDAEAEEVPEELSALHDQLRTTTQAESYTAQPDMGPTRQH